MGWVSHAHRCADCGHVGDELHDRDQVQDCLQCPACGHHTYLRTFSVPNISTRNSATRPEIGGRLEGSGARKDLKERQALRREARRLRKEGRLRDAAEVKQESRKLGGSSV